MVNVPSLNDKSDQEVVKDFRLAVKISLSNIHLFDAAGRIKKYESPENIIEEFYTVRLEYYVKRKEATVAQIQRVLKRLENKLRFLELIGTRELEVFRRSQADIFNDLKRLGFDMLPKEENEDNHVTGDLPEKEIVSYEYLVSMAVNSLTLEALESLEEDLKARKIELDNTNKLTPEQIWEADLKSFMDAWEVAIILYPAPSLRTHSEIIGIRARL